ncbi:hypothetical protein NL676_001242 [Syzygium grande]|nr:hypothetical protein NL676_001242 [Syzygium grande]
MRQSKSMKELFTGARYPSIGSQEPREPFLSSTIVISTEHSADLEKQQQFDADSDERKEGTRAGSSTSRRPARAPRSPVAGRHEQTARISGVCAFSSAAAAAALRFDCV